MPKSESFLLNDSDDDHGGDDDDASTIQQAKRKHKRRHKHGKHNKIPHASQTDYESGKAGQEATASRSSPRQQRRLQKQRMHAWQNEICQQPQPLVMAAGASSHDSAQQATSSSISALPPQIPDRISSLSLVPITLSGFSEPTASSAKTIKPVIADKRASSVCIDMSFMNGPACHLLLNCPELRRNKHGRLCVCVPPEHTIAVTSSKFLTNASEAAAGGSEACEQHSVATATFDTKVERWLAAFGDDDDHGEAASSVYSEQTVVQKCSASTEPSKHRSKDAMRQSARSSLPARVEDVMASGGRVKEQRRRGMHESDAVVQAYMQLCAGEQEAMA